MGTLRVKDNFLLRQRNAEFKRVYRNVLREIKPPFKKTDVIEIAIKQESSRFWVSEERAVNVINKIRNKDTKYINAMSASKTAMYNEIYRRILILEQSFPNLSMTEKVSRVIQSKAPEFYLDVRNVTSYIV